jgi:Tfp pilus assembly protein PilF
LAASRADCGRLRTRLHSYRRTPLEKAANYSAHPPQSVIGRRAVDYDEGNEAEARQEFARSLQFDPENNDTRYYLAMLDEREGKFEEARKGVEEVVKSDPNHAGAQQELGVIRLRQGDVVGARTFPRNCSEPTARYAANKLPVGGGVCASGNDRRGKKGNEDLMSNCTRH